MNSTDANRIHYDAPDDSDCISSMREVVLSAIMKLDNETRVRLLSKYAWRYGWNEFKAV